MKATLILSLALALMPSLLALTYVDQTNLKRFVIANRDIEIETADEWLNDDDDQDSDQIQVAMKGDK